MSTTTTTEISSNSNSSCRLLECLSILPFHDQRVFRSLLGHIELVRLSACCRSLRSSIRNDKALWQELYHRAFLSGAYYAKEMDFVLWCVRTDVNNPCTSDKRADLLENVDWYNTYRRRVSTESNWRYGRYNTTHIDMKSDNDGIGYRKVIDNDRMVIIQQRHLDRASDHYYSLEYLPHSNLKSNNNIVYNSTFSTSPNVISLDSGNETKYNYVSGDHYIAVSPEVFKSNANYNVKILSRKHGGVFTTFDVPLPYQVDTIKGNWVLLVNTSQELANVMVFDIEHSVMCPGSIDGTWDATCFYKTTNNTAIVYTARLVKDDDVDRIEWALYQFSNDNPVIQLRNGWFQLPKGIATEWLLAYNSYDSCMIIEFGGHPNFYPYIMHSVASNDQSHTPRNCYTVIDQHMPTPLLRAGCNYSGLNSRPVKVWTDLSYIDDQVLRIRGTDFIDNIIGDLYVFNVEHNDIESRLLVDINTKEIIRELEAPNHKWGLPICTMFGMLCSADNMSMHIIQEYGEL